ncbi:hypothetical protein HHI36_002848, partial [Cryptolaemus montrouzieri]
FLKSIQSRYGSMWYSQLDTVTGDYKVIESDRYTSTLNVEPVYKFIQGIIVTLANYEFIRETVKCSQNI